MMGNLTNFENKLFACTLNEKLAKNSKNMAGNGEIPVYKVAL